MSLPSLPVKPSARRFAQDEHGFVLVFFAVCIPALLGLVGLAIDGARLMALDTQLAAIADAGAIAAATQLDRSPAAIRNARAAANALTNRPTLADGGTAGMRSSFRFAQHLADLRRNPSFSLGEPAAESANFVEVTTADSSLTTSFLQLVGARSVPIRRRAVAESQYYACDVTPAILCQPDPQSFVAKAKPGRQFLLRYDGGKAAGSIALLDRPDAVDGRSTLRNFASDAPGFCYAEGVRLRTNLSPIEFDDAIGIRFDRYRSRTGPVPPDLAVFPPAPNVLKGRYYDTCQSEPQVYSFVPPFGLPRDSAYQGFRPSGFWDQGIGDWKTAPQIGGSGGQFTSALNEYIGWNHNDKAADFQDRLRNSRTRYELYLRELGLTPRSDATPVDTKSLGRSVATMPSGGPNTSPQKESAVPICYAGGRPAVQARRRILYLAIADCGAFPDAATAENLSRRVGKFFLTEPSELGVTLLEFVNFVQPADDDGKLRHVVQLVTTD